MTTVAIASQVCALVWRIRDEDKGSGRITAGERACGGGLRDRRLGYLDAMQPHPSQDGANVNQVNYLREIIIREEGLIAPAALSAKLS